MLQGKIIPILDPNERKNERFFGNASKHKVRSDPLSKPMYPKISITRNFQSLPTLKRRKIL
jgi:hypothetical protein